MLVNIPIVDVVAAVGVIVFVVDFVVVVVIVIARGNAIGLVNAVMLFCCHFS